VRRRLQHPIARQQDEAEHEDLLLISILEGGTSKQELLEDVLQEAWFEV
jgi:hypothetical protein